MRYYPHYSWILICFLLNAVSDTLFSVRPLCGMLTTDAIKNASFSLTDEGPITDTIPVDCGENVDIQELTHRYSVQGIKFDLRYRFFWCLLCTASTIKGTTKPLKSCLVRVGETEEDVKKHCACCEHLQNYEEKNPINHYCSVSIHGQKMLLENHCIYPSTAFGSGIVLMDETLSQKMMISQDVCGGVRLTPYHQYFLVDLVLPHNVRPLFFVHLPKSNPEKTRSLSLKGDKWYSARKFHSGYPPTVVKVLEKTNRKIEKQLGQWCSSEFTKHTND